MMRHAEDLDRFHERILEAARGVVQKKQRNEFTIQEITQVLRDDCPEFTERAIRAAILSSCHRSGQEHNVTINVEFESVGHGANRLLSRLDTESLIKHEERSLATRSSQGPC
jgi:hypothetical protein